MTLKRILAVSTALVGLTVASGALAYGSDYTFTDNIGGLQPEGTYANVTNPHDIRTDGAWGSYLAPDGTGTFEVVNGAGDPTLRFYYETVNLAANVPYHIAADIVDNYSVSAPVIQLLVDGTAVGSPQTLTAPYGEFQDPSNNVAPTPGPWIIHNFSYTPTVGGEHVIAFVDTNTAADGNDFSFNAAGSGVVPEPASWALMTIGVFGLGASLRARRQAIVAV